MTTLAEVFALARKCHQARDYRQAGNIYHQILRADPGNAQVWCFLGQAYHGEGRLEEAANCLQQAIWLKPNQSEAQTTLGKVLAEQGKLHEAIVNFQQVLRTKPDDADTRYFLGNSLAALGQLDQAVIHFHQVLQIQPDHVDALTSLGIALARQARQEEAVAVLQQALRLRPDHAKAHNNLAVALAELGRRDDAKKSWREAVRLKPDYAEAHFNLGVTLAEEREFDEAITCYEKAIQCKTDYAEAFNNLGLALVETGRLVEAAAVLRQAIRLKPDYAEAHNNLGLALVDQGMFAETLAAYNEALRLRPQYVEAHNNLGTALAAMARTEEALAAYQHAIWLRLDYAEVRWNRALSLLQLGRFEEGWKQYEWRWKRKRSRPREFTQPLWDGSPLEGKTILLHCEQGMGDTIQFIRYATLVKQRGGTVLVECPPEMMPILSWCRGIDKLVPERTDLPAFDLHAPLISLPAILGTTLANVPADVPYLFPEQALVDNWRKELADLSGPQEFKIGIAWQGNPKHRWDRHRSFPLALFEPISRIKGVRLFSLQKGPGIEQIAALADRFAIIDLGSRLDDDGKAFGDTGAVMKSLDLVITCDSALGHLAGALAMPVWVAVSFMVDWRWMFKRDDSPWYPSLRLFRQKELGNWEEVFERMTQAVGEFPRTRRPKQGQPRS